MRIGFFIGMILSSVVSLSLGWVAWITEPISFQWFIAPGELIAWSFIKGDAYSSYNEMAAHAIPIAIVVYTVLGMYAGWVTGAILEMRFAKVERKK